jgi:hypothetical protein
MYPLYLSITRSPSPLVSSHISLRIRPELSPHSNSIHTRPFLSPSSSQKVIDIHLYPSPPLLPNISRSISSPSVLSQYYGVYSIAPSSPVLFYSCSLYVIVIDSKSHQIYVLLLLPLQTLLHLLHFILWPL